MRHLLLAALLALPLPALADQITLDDGTSVNGELVDFQNGTYTVKIGKFMKQIPEARVVDVRAETAVAPGAPPAAPAGADGATVADPAAPPAPEDAAPPAPPPPPAGARAL